MAAAQGARPPTSMRKHSDVCFHSTRFEPLISSTDRIDRSSSGEPRRSVSTVNTPEKITWFIDGIPVASVTNHNWHLPMTLTINLSLIHI